MGEARLKKLGVGKRKPCNSLFGPGDSLCRMYVREGIVDIDDEQLCHQIVAVFPCEVPGCPETFTSIIDFEMHYNSRHRFICSQCNKPMVSAHFLDLHLSEAHDSFFAAQAERKPMFRCFVEECSVVSEDVDKRRSHCISVHSFPHDFRYDHSVRKNKKQINFGSSTSKMNSNHEPMIVDEVVHSRKKQFTFGHVKPGRGFSKKKSPYFQGGGGMTYKYKNINKSKETNEETVAEQIDSSLRVKPCPEEENTTHKNEKIDENKETAEDNVIEQMETLTS